MPAASQDGEWFNYETGKTYGAAPKTGGGFVWVEQAGTGGAGPSNTRNGNIDGGKASTNYAGTTPINGGNAFSVF